MNLLTCPAASNTLAESGWASLSLPLGQISQPVAPLGDLAQIPALCATLFKPFCLESKMPRHHGRPPMMLQFDKFIRPSMTAREVKQRYPETAVILEEEFGFRPICDGCSIETLAQRQGLSAFNVALSLNR